MSHISNQLCLINLYQHSPHPLLKTLRTFGKIFLEREVLLQKRMMGDEDMTLRKMCATAMGIALFVALSLCLQVPVFENYYLCLGYVVMAVYCYSFGVFSGTAVGVLGVVLYCLLIGGLRGMPGWCLGNLAIGVLVSLSFRLIRGMKHGALWWMIQIVVIILATAVGILGLKSLLEHFIYAQPFLLRTANNIYAFVADVVMLLVSLPICVKLDGYLRNYFSQLISK